MGTEMCNRIRIELVTLNELHIHKRTSEIELLVLCSKFLFFLILHKLTTFIEKSIIQTFTKNCNNPQQNVAAFFFFFKDNLHSCVCAETTL